MARLGTESMTTAGSQPVFEPDDHDFAAQPIDRFAAAAGVRLHYLDWGSAGTQPVIFLHGFGLTAHTWDVVCDLLHARAHCVAPDLRGHGDSEWSSDGRYPLQDHVDDLEHLIHELHIVRPVLVGMSLGGLVSLLFASRRADLVAALVLVDSGPRLRRPGANRIRDFMAAPAEADSIEEFVDRAVTFNPLRRKEQLRRSLMNNLRETEEGRWTWKYDRRLVTGPRLDDERAEAERAALQDTLWKATRAIKCPTLVVRGSASDLFLDSDATELVGELEHGQGVLIEGAGHNIQGDRPYALSAALRTFLETNGFINV
jgi:pimeloyl-ACP methyl ester carboxylesterase